MKSDGYHYLGNVISVDGYYDAGYDTVTYYFELPRDIFGDRYEDADFATISIEFPRSFPFARDAGVCISPNRDGSDYDWEDCDWPYDVVQNLIDDGVRLLGTGDISNEPEHEWVWLGAKLYEIAECK